MYEFRKKMEQHDKIKSQFITCMSVYVVEKKNTKLKRKFF